MYTDWKIIDWIDLIGPALWIIEELSNVFNCIYLNTSNMIFSSNKFSVSISKSKSISDDQG